MLTLPIKKKWFGMILSGERKEEYRDIKPYYESRFRNLWGDQTHQGQICAIRFRNGYRADSPSLIAAVTLDYGSGRPEWGAEEGVIYYILHIHDVKTEDK